MIQPQWLLLLYFIFLVPLCLKAKQAQLSSDAKDHYLASHTIGPLILFLTLFATSMSGNTFMAQAGQAFYSGYSWVMGVGLLLTSMMGFHWLVPKLRPLAIKHGFVTPGDWLRYRFGDQPLGIWLRRLASVCLCVALCNFIYSQLKASGEAITVMTDGYISYGQGVVIFAIVVLMYDSVGGLRAVAWTDAFQGLIMFCGLACLLLWLTENSGGLAQIAEKTTHFKPETAVYPGVQTQIKWVSLMLMTLLSIMLYPQAVQRVYASSSHRSLNYSFGVMGLIVFLLGTTVILVGWAAIPVLENVPINNRDQVLPYILGMWAESSPFNQFAANLTLLAVFAAIMSTADSVLLSLVSILKHDFTQASERSNLRQDYWIAMIVMLVIGLCALNRDITLWRLMEFKMEILLQCFPVFILALHSSRIIAQPYLLGLLSGVGFLLVSCFMGVQSFWGVNGGLVALAINIVVVYLSHWLTRKRFVS